MPRRGRAAAVGTVRHRARRPAAGYPRWACHAGREPARRPPGQGAPAVDWSTRPLPEPWLEYAALDVEVLVELRALIQAEFVAAGRTSGAPGVRPPARPQPAPRVDAWRRTSGCTGCAVAVPRRGPGAVGDPRRDRRAARRHARPHHPRRRDRGRRPGDAPGPRRPAVDQGLPRPRRRAVRRPLVAALRAVADLPEAELPTRSPCGDGPAPAPGPRRTRSPPAGSRSPAMPSPPAPRS